jgi:glycosyltransferase involved in cell wall biosynthesis
VSEHNAMVGISVVIITLNEECNITRCIQSVQGVADEVLVVDSRSTDRTCELAIGLGARIISHDWEGYAATKNYANGQAKFDHILSLDADEALSEKLKQSILELKEKWPADGYSMNRLTNYCDHWIRHCGWYPDQKLRLFNKNKGRWTGEIIHEAVTMDLSTTSQHLKGDLLHYSYYSIADHIMQAEKFTDLTAIEAFRKGKNAGRLKVLFAPKLKFLRDYLFNLGFLDGFYGYTVCRISAHATYLKYNKLRQFHIDKPKGQ